MGHLFCVIIFAFLTACDGGIFGTGDGENQTVGPDMSTEANGASPGDTPISGGMQEPIDGATTDGATTDGTTTSGNTTDGQVPDSEPTVDSSLSTFSNTDNVSGRSDALLRFVNAHIDLNDSIVATINNLRDTALLPLPGLSFVQGSSDYLSINATESTSIELLLAEDFRANLFDDSKALAPLELIPGSVSTLIVRAAPGAESGSFEILPLVTRTTSTNNQASLRVIHAAKSFSTENIINVLLSPADGTRDQAITGFVSLNYIDQPETTYVDVDPGQYAIEFDTESFTIGLSNNINPITLTAGQTVTLIIRDTQTGTPGKDADIILLQDSQLP